LVAKAISDSRWRPFREKDRTFDESTAFFPINISAVW